MHPAASLREWAVIGAGSVIEQGAEVRQSILWEDVRVRAGKKVINAIVTADKEVASDLINGIL